MKHALVIGGTGMLSGVSLWLLAQGYHVSVIARNADRMKNLIEQTNLKGNITPILVDYKRNEELQEKVQATIEQNGSIDMVVAWVHSTAPEALEIIAKEVSSSEKIWELFHVLGSSTDVNKIKKRVTMSEDCLYHQIRLGFVIEDNCSRWLTNKEISDGVIASIEERSKIRTVGQIEPWEKRP
ncbi:SDR family NAD(P)-dependent oxidoreductase [Ralstonia pickettii]|nr:SDR family NAD(P)-dependent oxidoreductase [Ralstonia pickettii]